MNSVIRNLLPDRVVNGLRRFRHRRKQAKRESQTTITEIMFREILIDHLNVRAGDVVFVHSSVDRLKLDFRLSRVIPLLLEIIGDSGTLLFPTYPKLTSHDYLRSGEVFDVRKTPSYMGMLSEAARRDRRSVRSLHPTKSVCAIGPLARELTATHHASPYPYDSSSPYYKLIDHGGKVVGLGVSTESLSFVHCVDDALKKEFPVDPYVPELFRARCIDDDGEEVAVRTCVHDMTKMKHDVPKFVRKYISETACKDLVIYGTPFFRADARELFDELVAFARRGVTIYPRSVYKRT